MTTTRPPPAMLSLLQLTALLLLFLTLPGPSHASSSDLPSGFISTLIPGTGYEPVAIKVIPDGRVLVLVHADTGPRTGKGIVRVVENDVALSTSMLSIDVERGGGMEGLHDVAVHPDFLGDSPYLYVSYTASSPNPHNRISRWRIDGNEAVDAADEEILLILPDYPGSTDTHFGGAIEFNTQDGKLYVTVGDHQIPTAVQTYDNLYGKLLRMNDDGSTPADNPYYGEFEGTLRLIYGTGLRNPWKVAYDAGTNKMLINDVGSGKWEEVNLVVPKANYGWPDFEGPALTDGYTDPIHSFSHENGTPLSCAIVGGDVYRPSIFATSTFPSEYIGKFFAADLCNNWVFTLDTETEELDEFYDESDALPTDRKGGNTLDLRSSPTGALWQLRRDKVDGTNASYLYKIEYIGSGAPFIGTQPQDVSTVAGTTVSFDVDAFGTKPMSYQWMVNGVNIAGATSSILEISAVSGDDENKYKCLVTNSDGSTTSDSAKLTIIPGSAPVGTITAPLPGTTYGGGDIIQFSGTGLDDEDGVLDAESFSWSVEFHHDDHQHPFITKLNNKLSSQFEVPDIGETETNVFFRIQLILTDSDGASSLTYVDVLPRLKQLTLESDPPGLQLALDGQPYTSPIYSTTVEGVQRYITAPKTQTVGNKTYKLDDWSDGGKHTHVVSPKKDVVYTAVYLELAIVPTISPAPTPTPPAPTPPIDVSGLGYLRFTGLGSAVARLDAKSEPTVGKLELYVHIVLDKWKPASNQAIFGSDKAIMQLVARKSGDFKLTLKVEGDSVKVKSKKHEFSDGMRKWLRVEYDGTTGHVSFYHSSSTQRDATDVLDWDKLGTSIISKPGILRSIRSVVLGKNKPGATGKFPTSGKIYGCRVGLGGAVLIDSNFSEEEPDDWTLENVSYVDPSE